jgi:hypothetical protein
MHGVLQTRSFLPYVNSEYWVNARSYGIGTFSFAVLNEVKDQSHTTSDLAYGSCSKMILHFVQDDKVNNRLLCQCSPVLFTLHYPLPGVRFD